MQNLADALANVTSIWKGAAKLAALMIVLHCLCVYPLLASANYQSPARELAQEQLPDGVKIVRRVEPMAPGSTLIVKNSIGSIVLRGWDREQLFVQAIAVGESQSAPTLEINNTAAGTEVVVKDSSKRRFFGLLPPKIAGCDLIISIPNRTLADIKAVNGTIAASALDGSLKCETVNGRVQIERVLGRVEVKTVSGAISIARLAPSAWALHQGTNPGPNAQDRPQERGTTIEGLVAKSINGGIALEEVMGDVQVSTIHGKIEAKHVHLRGGDTTFETISGNLEVEMLRGVSEIIAKSMAGQIDIQVPNAKMIEESKTQVVVQLPPRPGSQPKTITLKTVSGKITVR